ncbi:hypothetical protein PMZ80_003137 [Knufia obscura]|uniref:GH16 domain-containing protein n=2 Tax=Knufia TaxID=430999 RepID=A0AAN8E9R4_9EURO|nr:hypothetical protein PMZ80_003137 [Knufia obscura]KAK5949323.1 hypothetical protein OHC33_009676 [Knufia fluminis]
MSLFTKSLFLLNILASSTDALPTNSIRAAQACGNTIEGAGTFMKSATYTFPGTTLPEGLHRSPDLIRDQDYGAPYNHIFEAKNVVVKDGFLNIIVPGGQNPASAPNQAISSAEVFTTESDILYASVRTHAIFSTEPGTCQSSFFYKTDNQETDIEYLSDPTSQSNVDGTADLHYTNQAIDGGDSTWSHKPAPGDIGTAVHEYRIDWTRDFTAFFVDGVLQEKKTENVPTEPGTWLWNNWSNGDRGWSVGPPRGDSVMKVQKIEMFYNTTGSAGSC